MASGVSKDMDWSLCIFCQKDTTEKLRNPTEESYRTAEKHLEGFKAAGAFPSSLKIEKFNDRSGIASTLAKHGARWHKNCRANYNQRMLERAEKRQHDEAEKEEGETRLEKRSRRESGKVPPQETCIFNCGKPGNLCTGSTYQLDSRIREAALKIGDTKLLAKLSAGDVIAIDVMYRLLQCFERTHDPVLTEPQVSAVLIDGAALVHILKPRQAKTFQEYSYSVFVPYVLMCLSTADRADIVWDCYRDNSLKSSVKKKRGSGIRRRVKGDVALPLNWPEFLRNSQNKEELFHFLSENLKFIKEDGKVVIATQGADFVSSSDICEDQRARLSPCSHEEADTRLILHCSDLARMNHTDVMIRTSDTDVVVLATAHCHSLQLEKLWVAVGAGSHFRHLPIHDYASTLGPEKAAASLMFHSLTGCDTVSFFFGVVKKTCWEVWISDPEFTQLFLRVLASPEKFQDDFSQIERFVSLMYKTSVYDKANAVRKHLFTKKGRMMETIPPTRTALIEHTKRAILQALIWKEALIPQPEIPDPVNWGWEQVDGTYSSVWTSLPDAYKVCDELLKCSCKKGCRGRCTCATAGVPCTALCFCDGKCQRD